MGLVQRIMTIFGGKINHALDAVEDPRETLDYAYERQRAQYKQLQQSIVTVATEKTRLAQQSTRLEQEIARWDQAARNYLAAGQESQATQAIEQKQAAENQQGPIRTQIDTMTHEVDSLQNTAKTLATRLNQMRQQKEMLKAQYSAAKAQADIQGALSSYSTKSEDWQAMFDRAQTRTLQMSAKAQALTELADGNPQALLSGVVEDPVRAELLRLKAEGASSSSASSTSMKG